MLEFSELQPHPLLYSLFGFAQDGKAEEAAVYPKFNGEAEIEGRTPHCLQAGGEKAGQDWGAGGLCFSKVSPHSSVETLGRGKKEKPEWESSGPSSPQDSSFPKVLVLAIMTFNGTHIPVVI